MFSIDLYNTNNLDTIEILKNQSRRFNLIYSDMIYENKNLEWIDKSISLLKDNSIFIVQTDYHSVVEVKQKLDSLGLHLVNWCIYINDWGGVPKKGFPRKHDDILIYSNGKDFKWYPNRIQIPKVTAGTKFDKKGTGLKTPPDVFYDHPSFSTMAKERIKFDNKNIKWQKPYWLMERLLLPFTDTGDDVLDLFMGSGTLGQACTNWTRSYVGIESNTDVFNLAYERIYAEECPY